MYIQNVQLSDWIPIYTYITQNCSSEALNAVYTTVIKLHAILQLD